MSTHDMSPGQREQHRDGAAEESPVLIHVWAVDPAHQAVAVQSLGKMLGEVAGDPGFVSARVLESADRSSLAVLVEMRTVADRQRIEELPVVRQTLDQLAGTVNVVLRLYRQIDAYP